MHEYERGAILQSKSAYKISSSYAVTVIASGGENQPDQEATESSDHQGASGSCGATNSSSNIRLQNTRHSSLYSPKTRHKSQRKGQTVDSAVRESPRTRPFLQDMKQTEKINAFSKRAKKLITNMGNTELFEVCEISSKTQCSNCSLYWNIDIVSCSLGRSLIPSQRKKQLDKKNYDAFSIHRYVIKKGLNSSMVRNMELPKGNECTIKHRRCCKKLANPNKEDINPYLSDGTTITITEILCHSSGGPRSTSSRKITHTCHSKGQSSQREKLGTLVEWRRIEESTSWFCWSKTKNFKDFMMNMWKKLPEAKYTDSSYTTNKTKKRSTILRTRMWLSSWSSDRIGDLPFEVTEKTASNNIFVLVNSVGTARRVEQKLEFLAIFILDWTLIFFIQRCSFRLLEICIPKQSTEGVDRYTCRTPHFTCTVVAQYRRHVCLAQDVKYKLCSQNTHFIHASWLILCCTRHWALPHNLFL